MEATVVCSGAERESTGTLLAVCINAKSFYSVLHNIVSLQRVCCTCYRYCYLEYDGPQREAEGGTNYYYKTNSF